MKEETISRFMKDGKITVLPKKQKNKMEIFEFIYNHLIEAFKQGDLEEARKLQMKSIDIVNIIIRHGGGTRGGKAIMHLLGIDCGNCRPPFSPITENEYTNLKEELKQVNLL